MLFLCAFNGTGSSDSHWKTKFNGCIYNSNVLLISNINTMVESLKCLLQRCKSRSHTDAVQTLTWLAGRASCHYIQGVQHSCAKVTDLSPRAEVQKIWATALQHVSISFLNTAGFAFLNVNSITYVLSSHCLWLLCRKLYSYVLFCSFCFIIIIIIISKKGSEEAWPLPSGLIFTRFICPVFICSVRMLWENCTVTVPVSRGISSIRFGNTNPACPANVFW